MTKKATTKNQMSKNIKKEVAEIHGCTVQYVNMVLRGERNSAEIVATYQKLVAGRNRVAQAVARQIQRAKQAVNP